MLFKKRIPGRESAWLSAVSFFYKKKDIREEINKSYEDVTMDISDDRPREKWVEVLEPEQDPGEGGEADGLEDGLGFCSSAYMHAYGKAAL